MSRLPAATVAAAWSAWAALALPSAAQWHAGDGATRALWRLAPALAAGLEPLSRPIPAALLDAAGPAAALLTAGIALRRHPAWGAALLLGSASWGLAPAHDATAALLADLPTAFQHLPFALEWLKEAHFPSLAIGLAALLPLALPPLQKSLIVAPWRRAINTHHDASTGWAPAALVRHMARGNGMPLGRIGRKILRYPGNDPTGTLYQGHHFIIAATRSGKGVGAVIPAILDHDGPVCCVDIKGENYAICKEAREAAGYSVFALNPFDVLGLGGASLNPLDFIPSYAADTGAAALAVALIREEPGAGGGDHFVRLARALVAAAIEVVLTVAEPPERHLVTVLDLVCGPGAADAFAAWIATPDLCGGRPARAVASFMGKDTKERDMVISTVRANMGFIGGEAMQKFFKAADNKLMSDHVLNGRTDIFIIMPLEQIAAQQNFFRLIVSLLVNTIMGSKNRKLSTAMLMVLDEFPVLGAMEQIKDLFTIGAGSNIQLLTIVQDIARLRDVWGYNGAQSLLAQAATIRILGLGAGDIDTARLVSDLLPRIDIRKESTSFDGADITMDRAQYNEREKPLMTADEVLKMPSDKGICLIRGHNPMRFKKIQYFHDRHYAARAGVNPYQRSV